MRWISIFLLFVVIATLGITNWKLSKRVGGLEVKLKPPELVHTCELFDNQGRKVCGFIEIK